MEVQPKIIVFYARDDGTEPFKDWLLSLKDRHFRDIVEKRIERVKLGNYGDYKSLGDGLFELRFLGLGLRVYFGEAGSVIVVLLWGGEKNKPKDQNRDIERARRYWDEFKRALQEGYES